MKLKIHPTFASAESLQGSYYFTGPHKLGVKITSPSKNATVPAGPLIISGISSHTGIMNCMVSADWNDLKPMQNVTAKVLVEQMTIQIGHILTTKPTII